jgi:hypothetical protein
MKVSKTSVHRLSIEKNCGCQATREYEDLRYTKPLGEAAFAPCEKHSKGAIAEFAGDMLIEALDKEAESAGKTAAVTVRGETPTALSGTSGGSVTSMGTVNVKPREKQNPLKSHTATFDRPNLNHPQNTAYGNLNVAGSDLTDEEINAAGITMDGSIEGVPQDPRVDDALNTGLKGLEEVFDDEDAKAGGVDRNLVNRQAVD